MKWPRQAKRWLEEATKGKAQWVWRVEKKDHALTLPFPWLKAYYKILWNLWITFEVRSLFKVNEAQQQISHKLWSDNCFRDACVRHDCWSRSQRNAHPLLKGTQTKTADIIGVCISFKKQHLLLDKHSLNIIQECQLSYIYSTGMGLSQGVQIPSHDHWTYCWQKSAILLKTIAFYPHRWVNILDSQV